MDTTVVQNWVKHLPDNVNQMIVYAMIIGGWWLWKNIIKPTLLKYRNKQKEESEENIRRLNLAVESIVDIYHNKMWSLKSKCSRKGYRTDTDTHNFELIYHKYSQLGGNTDGEDIKRDFMNLPDSTVLELKERKGVDNPDDEYTQAVVDFVKMIKSGAISEDDAKDTMRFVNAKRQKKEKEIAKQLLSGLEKEEKNNK